MHRTFIVLSCFVVIGCEDTEPPRWPDGAELTLSYTQVLRDTPPSTLAELREYENTIGLDFSWPQATDNVAVANYRIKKGDEVVVTVPGTKRSAHFETSSPVGTYVVEAGDPAGNWAAGPSAKNELTAQRALAPPDSTTFAVLGTSDSPSGLLGSLSDSDLAEVFGGGTSIGGGIEETPNWNVESEVLKKTGDVDGERIQKRLDFGARMCARRASRASDLTHIEIQIALEVETGRVSSFTLESKGELPEGFSECIERTARRTRVVPQTGTCTIRVLLRQEEDAP